MTTQSAAMAGLKAADVPKLALYDQPLSGMGNFSRDFDAGVVIWDFFKQHPMP